MENNSDTMRNRRPLTLDGIRPLAPKPVPPARVVPPPRIQFRARPAPRKQSLLQKLQLPLLVVVCVTGGFFADSLVLGLLLITGYGVFVLVARVPSHITFTLALLLLGTISLLLLFKSDSPLIHNFATYAFVLLVLGVITLAREAKLPKRTRRKYRR